MKPTGRANARPMTGSAKSGIRLSTAETVPGLRFTPSGLPLKSEAIMSRGCSHIAGIQDVTPSALGCEECLKSGSEWLHLRICRTCGHVGCCDDSPNKHASAHFHASGHPVIEGYDPPEGWGWCYVDKVAFDLSKRKTPHNGPIPRYY
jgi:hypothetical protein